MIPSAYKKILNDNGYDADTYLVDVFCLNETNQVIHVINRITDQWLSLPVEDNVLIWSEEDLAETIVSMLNDSIYISP